MPFDSVPQPIEPLTWRADSLLPPTAPLMQRIRERAVRLPATHWAAAARVGDIHRDLPDAALPFLIFELGLDEITPWVADLRRAIAEGRQWQRIRGTPVSIEMALGWIDAPLVQIEEMGATTWWDLFQLELSRPLHRRRDVAAITALTRLSKPSHDDVVRLYNRAGDQRMVETSTHWTSGGELIGDWSGLWLDAPAPTLPKLAFKIERRGRSQLGLGADAMRSHLMTKRQTRLRRARSVWTGAAWSDQAFEPDALRYHITTAHAGRMRHTSSIRRERIGAWSLQTWSPAAWAH